MDDSTKRLEERLEQLVPRGLSDGGRARLDAQIEALAAEAETSTRHVKRWRPGLGIAAAAAAVAGVAVLVNSGKPAEPPVAGPAPGAEPFVQEGADAVPNAGFETVDFERTIGDGEDRGIVLDRFDEPMRAWNYNVREMELILDEASGLQVRIVQERREEVHVAVTSF